MARPDSDKWRHFLLPFVVMVGLGQLIQVCGAYKIQYVDCTSPAELHEHDLLQLCEETLPQHQPPESWLLTQEQEVSERKGWKCLITVSTFLYSCGAWNHLKTLTVPQILHQLDITPTWCREMVNTRLFKVPSTSEILTILPNRVNIFPVEAVGILEVKDGAVSCTGQEKRIKNQVLQNILEIQEYKVSITEEIYTVKGNVVEVTSDHLMLSCEEKLGACETGVGTFVWDSSNGECNLELIRYLKPQRMGPLFIDTEAKVIINSTDKVYMPSCRNAEILATTYPHIYLVREMGVMSWLKKATPRNLRMEVQITNLVSYIMFEMETLISTVDTSWARQLCSSRFLAGHDTPTLLRDDLYGLVRGQVMFSFKCKMLTGVVAELDTCFSDIPLVSSPQIWVDPSTLIRKNYSPIISCDTKYPLKFKAENVWLAATPKLRLVVAPQKGFPDLMSLHNVVHEDLSKGGIYTDSEQAAWDDLLSFPQWHKASLQAFMLGTCSSDGSCPSGRVDGVPLYDLGKLLHQAEDASTWNLYTLARGYVLEYGAWLALLTILLTMGSWIINLCIFMISWLREGPVAALAFVMTVFCGGPRAYQQIQRRQRRERDQTRERAVRAPHVELVPLNQLPKL